MNACNLGVRRLLDCLYVRLEVGPLLIEQEVQFHLLVKQLLLLQLLIPGGKLLAQMFLENQFLFVLHFPLLLVFLVEHVQVLELLFLMFYLYL